MCEGVEAGISLVCSKKSQEVTMTSPAGRRDQQEMAQGREPGARGESKQDL